MASHYIALLKRYLVQPLRRKPTTLGYFTAWLYLARSEEKVKAEIAKSPRKQSMELLAARRQYIAASEVCSSILEDAGAK